MILNLEQNPIKIPAPSSPYAILSITKHGCLLAQKVGEKIKNADIYCPEKFQGLFHYTDRELRAYSGKVKVLLENIFHSYEGIIAIVSIGALVRLVGPLLKDKSTDPGVVAMDENGEYAVSVLSGHLGGGNELCRFVSEKTGAQAVITTSSDVRKTIPVDILGKSFGWEIEPTDLLTEMSAAIVNDEGVGILQDSGETSWIPRPLPDNLKIYSSDDEASKSLCHYFLFITHREKLPSALTQNRKYIIYRPKSIVLGIGCNRGTTSFEIENVIMETLKELNISIKAVHGMASIDLKKDEQGMIDFCKKFSLHSRYYPPEQLNSVPVNQPSETVFKYTGAYGVSEPAAKLYSSNNDLILEKKISGNVTLSIGLIKY